MKEIFTLGTSNRSLEEFLEILKKYKIKLVIDVRRFPTSKLFSYFKKENLKKILKENQIEYLHFESLGGFRKGGYKNYMKTKEFKEGLKKLIKLAEKKKVTLICREKFPWKCHRASISQKLEENGFKVIHIIEKDKIWQAKRSKKFQLSLNLFLK